MNRRPDRLIVLRVGGQVLSDTLAGWCRRMNLGRRTVEDRIKRGWTKRQALETPRGAKP